MIKGSHLSMESRKKIGLANKGKKLSQETKDKISAAAKGHIISPEQREKISATLKGHILSMETRQKMSKARTGAGHWNWRGGKVDIGGGYTSISVGKQKYKFEHRIVMEDAIGRPLKRREVVHHWNRNRKDNRIENLLLFRYESAHQRLHGFARRHKIPVITLKFNQPWL